MILSTSRFKALFLCFFMVFPIMGISKNNRPKATPNEFVCGTSTGREMNTLAKGLYYESVNRGRVFSAPGPARIQADVKDIAVIEDDGSIIPELKFFDLRGKSFEFQPTGTATYRAAATSKAFEATGGTSIVLTDDDSKLVNLGFSFTFYGLSYTSLYVNSDGNLTFVSLDKESNDRDLARFSSGPPRIGPFFNDLDPTGGVVSFRNDSDGTIFIWDKVPEFERANTNSFSVKLFKNGNIEFVYDAKVDAEFAVVGISPGANLGGIRAVKFSSDLPLEGLTGTIVEVFSNLTDISDTALAKKFFQTHPDVFDHLIIFLAFDHSLGGAYAYEINVKNEIQGVGLSTADNSSFYGSNGRLRSFLMMGSLDGAGRYPADPNQVYLGTNSTMGIMGQESGHRWLAFTDFQDAGVDSNAILGRQNAHWSFFFDSDGSVMEGNNIEDKGDGQFVTTAATHTYSRLDQYILGLLGKEDVPPMFLVDNPTGGRTRNSAPAVGIQFGGTRKEVTIDSIIAANGVRSPSVLQAPKVFRQAFVLLTKKGQTASPEQIAKVQAIRDAWVTFFNEQTGKRGWIVTDLQNGPGTTQTDIFYPYFQGGANRYTGIAVANWGSTPADVLFTAYDNLGNPTATPSTIINPRMITVPPGEQIAMLGEQIHGLTTSDTRNGWIRAQSTSSQVTGFFLDGDFDLKLLDGAVAGNRTATELYFTRASLGSGIFLGNTYKNLIDVVNPGPTTATVEFKFIDEFGATQGTATRTLNSRGRVAEDLATLFPSITQPRSKGYVKVTSNVGVVGYQSIDGGPTIYALPAQPTSTATKLYSAQFASGGLGTYFTDLDFINTSTQTRMIEILLVGNNGLPVASPTNPARRTLAPGQQVRERGESIFGLASASVSSAITEGSIVVTADGGGIIGDITFGDPTNERFLASLPLDSNPVSNLIFSQVAHGSAGGGKSYFTGIAMYNPGAASVTVKIDVFSAKGVLTGTNSLVLPQGNRVSRTLQQLVPAITNQLQGFIRLTVTGGSIITFELFGDQALEFLAAVPPQPITP